MNPPNILDLILMALICLFWLTPIKTIHSKNWFYFFIAACVTDLISTFIFVHLYYFSWEMEENKILHLFGPIIGYDTAIIIHILALIVMAYIVAILPHYSKNNRLEMILDYSVGFAFYVLAIIRWHVAISNIFF